jgi:hypothetical protein
MKKMLMVIASMLLVLWAVMFFVLKTGAVAHIFIAVAGTIILFVYSMRRVIT